MFQTLVHGTLHATIYEVNSCTVVVDLRSSGRFLRMRKAKAVLKHYAYSVVASHDAVDGMDARNAPQILLKLDSLTLETGCIFCNELREVTIKCNVLDWKSASVAGKQSSPAYINCKKENGEFNCVFECRGCRTEVAVQMQQHNLVPVVQNGRPHVLPDELIKLKNARLMGFTMEKTSICRSNVETLNIQGNNVSLMAGDGTILPNVRFIIVSERIS